MIQISRHVRICRFKVEPSLLLSIMYERFRSCQLIKLMKDELSTDLIFDLFISEQPLHPATNLGPRHSMIR